MKIIKGLIQGSNEWHEHRAKYRNASVASIIMGASPYKTRTQLLDERATGITPEIDAATQKRFDDGHRVEDLARNILEHELHQDLYPVVGIDGNMSASFDGMSLDGKIIFEHKLWNESKAEDVRNGWLPAADFWQVIHQLYVSRAEVCIYVVSDGTTDKRVRLTYELASAEKHFDELLAGWAQFEADLEAHVVEAKAQVHETESAGVLPVLRVEVQGKVLATNIDQFRDAAKLIISAINSDLNDDADFAQAEADVKWCKDVETKLEAKEQAVMAQTADIATVIDMLREVKEDARQKRLTLDKLVKERKQAIRLEIAYQARESIDAHVNKLQASLPAGYTLPTTTYSLNDAMKGKKTVSSLRDAANTEAARVKAEAAVVHASILANAKQIEDAGHPHLFADKAQLAHKPADDLANLIKLRIAEEQQRKEAEAKTQQERIQREAEEAAERERERIREEEQAKAQQHSEEVRQAAVVRLEQQAAQIDAKPYPASRKPSRDEIIEALMQRFNATRNEVFSWIAEINEEQAALPF